MSFFRYLFWGSSHRTSNCSRKLAWPGPIFQVGVSTFPQGYTNGWMVFVQENTPKISPKSLDDDWGYPHDYGNSQVFNQIFCFIDMRCDRVPW